MKQTNKTTKKITNKIFLNARDGKRKTRDKDRRDGDKSHKEPHGKSSSFSFASSSLSTFVPFLCGDLLEYNNFGI